MSKYFNVLYFLHFPICSAYFSIFKCVLKR